MIVSACESTPCGLAMDVQRQDRFWIKSRPLFAHVAARAIILIEADGPVIGLVACVPVGMSEV